MPGELEVLLTVAVDNAASVLPSNNRGLHVIDASGRLRTYDSSGEVVAELETGVRAPEGSVIDAGTGRLAIGSTTDLVIVDPAIREVMTVQTFGFVQDVTFVQGGKMLAIARSDGSVRLWDVEQQVSLGELWDAGEAIIQIWYDAEATSLWVRIERQLVELSVDPAVRRERACENPGRDLTQEEWDQLVPGGGDVQSACTRRTSVAHVELADSVGGRTSDPEPAWMSS